MGKKINIRPTTGVYATYKNIKYDPKLTNLNIFDTPKSLADYGVSVAPQSFVYVHS